MEVQFGGGSTGGYMRAVGGFVAQFCSWFECWWNCVSFPFLLCSFAAKMEELCGFLGVSALLSEGIELGVCLVRR